MSKIVVIGSHAESLLIFRKEMLAAMAVKNRVIACVPEASFAVRDELFRLGIEYQDIQLARTGLNPFADIVTIHKLFKLFKKIQPDQVFAYTSKPVIFGSIAARLAGVKNIYAMITGLGSYFIYKDPKSLLVRSIMVILYKIALVFNTKIFFQNPDDQAEFARLGIFNNPSRTVMINGSGVNTDYFAVSPLPAQTSFILIARLIRAKGVYEYLEAARLVKKQHPETQFLLVGWFDAKQEVIEQAKIQEYITDNTIQFLGKLEDVRPALAQSSVFVLPSYREGTPRSVLEAMASGRAIITTDVPGCRETVQHGDNGFLVPARNVPALVAAMEKFVNDPSLIQQMGQRSRQLAEHKFNVHAVNTVILGAMEPDYV